MGACATGGGLAASVSGRAPAAMSELDPTALAVIGGYHANPFAYLGSHVEDGRPVVRAYLPGAERVSVVGDRGEAKLSKVHGAGLFVGPVESTSRNYRLRAKF